MGAMPWFDRALGCAIDLMRPTHGTRALCPVDQEEIAMGAMPWLVAVELDLTEGTSNMPRPWAP